MIRHMTSVAVIAATLGLASEAAAQRQQADCRITIRGSVILDGPCLMSPSASGFSLRFAEPDPAANLFQIMRTGPNAARLRWSSPDSAEIINRLSAAGACWVNATTELCVWRPGERTSAATPSLDELDVPQPRRASVPRFPPDEPYARAREALLRLGFVPHTMPDVGQCLPGNGRCEGRPEFEDCSGTGRGYCSFTWRGPEGQIIQVVTAGDEPVVQSVSCRTNCR